MKVKLTWAEFDTLINKRYVIPSLNKKGAVSITASEYKVDKSKDVLLYSCLESIELNDGAMRQQLNTLFGVPEGLFSQEKKNSKRKDAFTPENFEWTPNDSLFLAFRRALLYMSVWMIKDYGESALQLVFNKWFNPKIDQSYPMLLNLIRQLATQSNFPKQIPPSPSLDSSQYDYQFNWLGIFLGKELFKGSKMDDVSRQWIIALASYDCLPVPATFKHYETVIKGYLVALDLNRRGEFKRLELEKLALMMAHDDQMAMEIIAMAYLFLGMFEKKADRYYMTAGARALMVWIEKFAFGAAFGYNYEVEATECIQALSQAKINRIANCVSFYETKNPAITSRQHYEYSSDRESDTQGKVVVLQPHECKEFMERHQPLVNGNNLVRDYLHVTSDPKIFNNLAERGAGVLCVDAKNNRFSAYVETINLDKKILLWDQMEIPDGWFKGKRYNFESVVGCDKKKFIIVMINDSKLEHVFGSILRNYLKSMMDGQLLVLNFTQNSDTFIDIQKKKSSKKQSLSNKVKAPSLFGELQGAFERFFPKMQVRVITKQADDDCWEMVSLAIGTLKHVDFSDVKIFDFRVRNDFEAEPLLMRFFRDTIVYDDEQRYFFLNL